MPRRSITPIALAPLIVKDDQRADFLTPLKRVEVSVTRVGLLHALLETCDGTRSVDYITDELGPAWGREIVEDLIAELLEEGVLIDSQSIWPVIRDFVSNPAPWGRPLSTERINDLVHREPRHPHAHGEPPRSEIAVFKVLEQDFPAILASRCSCRVFEPASVPEEALARLCWAAYGLGVRGRTVPSAGALYPLAVHVVLLKKCGRLEPGAYAVLYPQELVVELHHIPSGGDMMPDEIFVDASPCFDATGYFVISADVDIATAKYASRGIIYTLLEAGHVAQNIHIACQTDDLGSVEVGGFFEDAAEDLLALREGLSPIISVVFGKVMDDRGIAASEDVTAAFRNTSSLVLCNDVEYSPSTIDGYTLPFSMCFARSARDATWSCGRSSEPEIAKAKALAENFERAVADGHLLLNWVEGSYASLRDFAIDPRDIHPYLPDQFGGNAGIVPFVEDASSTWLPVESLRSGRRALLLGDLAVFPYLAARRYAYANSSGLAAHIDRNMAIMNGVEELIERDAFMITWANRLAPRAICVSGNHVDIPERLERLRALELDIALGDIGGEFGSVPLVSVRSTAQPFFTCAAAYRQDPVTAIDHALMEVESKVYCWLRDGPVHQHLLPTEADSPDDHAAVYQNARWIPEADFLMQYDRGKPPIDVDELQHPGTSSAIAALIERGYEPFVLDLGRSAEGLHAVRVVVPGLVPMAFGYGLDALGSSRLLRAPSVLSRVGARDVDTLNRFLHPYD